MTVSTMLVIHRARLEVSRCKYLLPEEDIFRLRYLDDIQPEISDLRPKSRLLGGMVIRRS